MRLGVLFQKIAKPGDYFNVLPFSWIAGTLTEQKEFSRRYGLYTIKMLEFTVKTDLPDQSSGKIGTDEYFICKKSALQGYDPEKLVGKKVTMSEYVLRWKFGRRKYCLNSNGIDFEENCKPKRRRVCPAR